MAAETETHRKNIEIKKSQIDQKKREILQIIEENEEIIQQITQDTAFEIEDINNKNKNNKTQVGDMSLKSKAELQLTSNKLQDIDSDIDQYSRQIQDKDHQIKQQDTQTKLLKDKIAVAIKDIQEKDRNIGAREKKIYSLKKKTQELEKFKFVLDYKIKDLKRDITPRQNDILNLKQETNAMDKELKRYNRLNANLGYLVDDLRTKQEYMSVSIKTSRATIRQNEIYIRSYKNAVYWVLQNQMDPELLRRAANQRLYEYIKDKVPTDVEVDSDIKKEMDKQK
jgi:cilia- and flagella-associated protein 57